jgi:osmoprotectant transport system permease protein
MENAMRNASRAVAAVLLMLCWLAAHAETLHIGSKRFTESYVLGEILSASAAPYAATQHRMGLGNTAILYEALRAGEIDVYPEYLGTIEREILHRTGSTSIESLNAGLAPLGLAAGVPLGFSNSYGLALRNADAQRLGIQRISDLAAHPNLRYGLSHEFLGRADGWPGLAQRYRLNPATLALDHGLAYDALGNGQVDVIDVYTTDARIAGMDLRVLDDDLGYFPRYDAVLLYRADLPQRFPAAWRALQGLQGRISQSRMIALNAAVELHGASFAGAARDFMQGLPEDSSKRPSAGLGAKLFDADLARLTRQHLLLVLVSVGFATLAGIPLGVAAAALPALRQPLLAFAGVLQTIPSLALFAMLIPLFGAIGTLPAVVALSVYALLPVVRNTCIGLMEVPAGLKLAARGLGLNRRDRLLYIELPLALPVMFAGIKTAAVMSVGTATIAAFIGAGGYGERIAIGLALNDRQMLLAGAIPAALLALATQWLFELVERLLLRRR